MGRCTRQDACRTPRPCRGADDVSKTDSGAQFGMFLAQSDCCSTPRFDIFPILYVGLAPPVSRDRARFEAELDAPFPEPHTKVNVFHMASKAHLIVAPTFRKRRAPHRAVGSNVSVIGPLWLGRAIEAVEALSKFGVLFFRSEAERSLACGKDRSHN